MNISHRLVSTWTVLVKGLKYINYCTFSQYTDLVKQSLQEPVFLFPAYVRITVGLLIIMEEDVMVEPNLNGLYYVVIIRLN